MYPFEKHGNEEIDRTRGAPRERYATGKSPAFFWRTCRVTPKSTLMAPWPDERVSRLSLEPFRRSPFDKTSVTDSWFWVAESPRRGFVPFLGESILRPKSKNYPRIGMSIRQTLKTVATCIIPHAFWVMLRRRRHLGIRTQGMASPSPQPKGFDFDKALTFFRERGLDMDMVVRSSIRKPHLDFILSNMDAHVEHPRGLQIGTFVGMSLCALVDWAKARNSEVWSVDPNLRHRKIERPVDHAIALLEYFGLLDRAVLLTGYSLESNALNDSGPLEGRQEVSPIPACERALERLVAVAEGGFGWAFIDGNHEAEYLAREIAAVDRLLKPGGVLILDDISAGFPALFDVFDSLDPGHWTKLGWDQRIGVLKKRK